jgi:hypothetical protein
VEQGERLVGIGDIARHLCVTRQAVDYWTRKDPMFPAPLDVINVPVGDRSRGTRVWRKRDVDEWIVKHYRRRG